MKTCGMCKLYKTECNFSKVEAPKGMDPSTFVACADFMPNDDKVTNSSKEYIEREAVVEMIKENSTTRFDWSEAVDIEDLIPAIKDIPAADVEPIVHAKWEMVEKEAFWISNMEESIKTGKLTKAKLPVCSHCKAEFGTDVLKYKHCPECGAYMDGGKSNE